MLRHLKMYWQFLKYTFHYESAYRVDFILWTLVTIGWFTFTIAFYHLLFAHIDSIGGWNKGQIFVLQGMYFMVEFFLWGVLYGNYQDLPRRINRGEIDLELTKPINPQFLLSFKKFNLNQLTNLALGIGTIIYGLSLSGISPSYLSIMGAIFMFAVSAIYLYAGYFITVCLAFWAERLNDVVYLFPHLKEFSKLPLPAYNPLAKFGFTYFIPIVLVTTVPSQLFFGTPDYRLILILTTVALLMLYLSNLVFAAGLKRYSSASS